MPKRSRPIDDLTGKEFDWLTAKKYVAGAKWLCECRCGKFVTVIAANLKRKNTKSCGCQRFARFAIPVVPNPTKSVWRTLVRKYRGRPDKLCQSWAESFENFVRNVGERPEGHRIQRFPNVAGSYKPGNTIWVKRSEQIPTFTQFLLHNGESHTITEWAKIKGMKRITLKKRLEKMSLEDALNLRLYERRKSWGKAASEVARQKSELESSVDGQSEER